MDGTDEACCSAFFVKAECETEAFFFFFLILYPTKRSQQEHCTCDGKAADVGSDSVTTC